MRQSQREIVAGTLSGEPAWYHAYFLAMVEHDRGKALLEIENARNAIQQRVQEIRGVRPSNPREMQDLDSALTYLDILLLQMGTEGGALLWD